MELNRFQEAALRTALAEAAPLYRDTPEAKALRARTKGILATFMAEVLPTHSEDQRAFATDMVKTTIATLGKRFSEGKRSPEEIGALAKATADMAIGWITTYRTDTAQDSNAPTGITPHSVARGTTVI